MKNGTLYAGRLKRAYSKLRQTETIQDTSEPDDPLRRLAIGILGEGCTDAVANRAVDRALGTMVDWNEMRVSDAVELNRATGNAIPQGTQRCRKLIAALQSIFDRENRLSLDRLKNIGRREARHFLEQLNGVDEYTVASVLLWSFGGHAIPVNDRLLGALREADLVNPTASRAEVQAFLERHIGAAEAKRFCLVMRSFTPKKPSGARGGRTKAAGRKKVKTRS